jgi:hypothetical protein
MDAQGAELREVARHGRLGYFDSLLAEQPRQLGLSAHRLLLNDVYPRCGLGGRADSNGSVLRFPRSARTVTAGEAVRSLSVASCLASPPASLGTSYVFAGLPELPERAECTQCPY